MIGCLMIHGFTGGPYELEPLATYLEQHTNWQIEVPTLPGHGRKLSLENVTHEHWIEVVEEKFQQLQKTCDRIYVIGFSMGGMIAAYIAAKYEVEKLVLLATSGKYLSFKQIGMDIADVIKDGVKGKLKDNRLYTHYKKKFGEVPIQANLEFLKLVHFTRKHLKDVESPVFIAQGQQDGMVPYTTAYYLDEEIRSTQKEIVLLERSKHLLCLGSDKDILNRMVYRFLTD
ncbi:MAG TPA: alpha/beta fold hydrolase [Bacillota bacterium]